MLIHLIIRDKRYGQGFCSKFFHENNMTPEIYKFVKKKFDKISRIDFGGVTYYRTTTPTITDFLKDYNYLTKE